MGLEPPQHFSVELDESGYIIAASDDLKNTVGGHVWDVWPAAKDMCVPAYEQALEYGASAWLTCHAGHYSLNQAFRTDRGGLRISMVTVDFHQLAECIRTAAVSRAGRVGLPDQLAA